MTHASDNHGSNVRKHAHRAVEELRNLQRAALDEVGFEGTSPSELPFELQWTSDMPPEELAENAVRLATECLSEHEAFRHRHVYCYACSTGNCEHSRPREPGHVFAGYEPTGQPRWQELFRFFLDIGDARTDRLFANRPQVLARVIGRRRLTAQQLVSFGRNSYHYRVVGQVVAGYMHVDALRAALTVQLVETADRAMHMQLIMPDALREALANAPEDKRSAFHRMHEALREARQDITSLGRLWQQAKGRDAKAKLRDKAFRTLRHLAHSLERKGRQHHRRTVHAEVRARQKRPVHKAYDDLTAAGSDSLYRDQLRSSIIVSGKGGRVHVFSEQGKLVTSLLLSNEELEKRRRRGRYVALEPSEAMQFKQQACTASD